MPLTKTGKEVMVSMRKQYGKRAKEVFYASINAKKPGSSKWHAKKGRGFYHNVKTQKLF